MYPMTTSAVSVPREADADRVPPFGSADYWHEELVAEMGTALFCAEGGISCVTIEGHPGNR
jgi:hypothetical protein